MLRPSRAPHYERSQAPLGFARAMRACHPDWSDPGVSCARFVCAGPRSGGTVAKLQPHLGPWHKAATSTWKLLAKIAKLRIHPPNQRKLLLPPPSLDLFFPADRVTNIAKALEINQPFHFILFREPITTALLVLRDASFQMARHPGVEHTTRAGKNINVVHHAAESAIPHSTCHAPLCSSRTSGLRLAVLSHRPR
jgi:hypothetical protein